MDAYIDNRISNLKAKMVSAKLDVAIISHPKHFFYFTGFRPVYSPHILVIEHDRILAIAPQEIPEFDTFTYSSYDIFNGWDDINSVSDQLQLIIARHKENKRAIGFEYRHLTKSISYCLESDNFTIVDIYPLLSDLKKVKDQKEINLICDNIQVNDLLFNSFHKMVHTGMKEIEVMGEVYKFIAKTIGHNFILESDFGCGLRSVNFGAQPGDSIISSGDFGYIDIFSDLNGYYADSTRSFVVGKPTKEQLNINKILEEAIQHASQALLPGNVASDVDHIVRSFISDQGYGDYYPHHTGHCFGLFQQEKPFIIPADHSILEEGMIVAIEPGIYLPGKGGMRLESNFIITRNGPQKLDQSNTNIIVCN